MKFKKILLTGGSRGIGRALLNIFLEDGSEVHVVSRKFDDNQSDTNLKFHSLDLTKTGRVNEFAENFIESYGIPDLLINNAGSGSFYEWNQFPETEIQNQLNLLFYAPVLLCRKIVPEMAKVDKGKIVNISSLATIYPLPYMPLYNACKSALSSFTKSMILEYQRCPVFIDVILGDVRTEFNQMASKSRSNVGSEETKSAWIQIEKQLNVSPRAPEIAKRLKSKIIKSSGGVLYEGGFLHRTLFASFGQILPDYLKNKILQKRYFNRR